MKKTASTMILVTRILYIILSCYFCYVECLEEPVLHYHFDS